MAEITATTYRLRFWSGNHTKYPEGFHPMESLLFMRDGFKWRLPCCLVRVGDVGLKIVENGVDELLPVTRIDRVPIPVASEEGRG